MSKDRVTVQHGDNRDLKEHLRNREAMLRTTNANAKPRLTAEEVLAPVASPSNVGEDFNPNAHLMVSLMATEFPTSNANATQPYQHLRVKPELNRRPPAVVFSESDRAILNANQTSHPTNSGDTTTQG